jgi:polar amino acid transport system substrate-binding protein
LLGPKAIGDKYFTKEMNMKNSFTRMLIACTCIFLAMSISTAFAASDAQGDLAKSSTIEKILRSGKMRVGMSTFVPWAMQSKTGEWIGFEIDVARRLAKDMGVEIEFVPTKWD